MAHYVVTAVGADRPGIVAAVSKVFVEHGCNLEDSAMTILGGQFAMMLVVDDPSGAAEGDLRSALDTPARELGLVVTVAPAVAPDTASASAGTSPRVWTVSVHGADRPGIVHGVAALLARERVNIVDLNTRIVGEADRPVYVMIMEVELPEQLEVATLNARLQAVAGELGVTANLHPSEADIL